MARNYKPTLVDLFCGTGGFAHGFTSGAKGFELLYAVDLDRNATATARANHLNTRIDTADIRSLDLAVLKQELGVKAVDVIIGGPPCQGFSSLRPSRGARQHDDRNDLFRNFANFVEAFRPKIFILENVVGLITHNGSSTLEKMLDTFSRLKYRVDWQILNAASYGVPQKRERFILMGARDNGPVSFPAPTHYFSGKVIGHADKSRTLLADSSSPKAISVNEAISDLPRLERGQTASQYSSTPKTAYQAERRNRAKVLTLHRAANHSDKMLEVIKYAGESIACIPSHLITSGYSSCYSRLNGDEPSTTITVKFQSPASSKCIHPVQHRTITPREAARLQSFDDEYVFKGSYTQIAQQLGNAVPPLLGKVLSGIVFNQVAK